VVTKAQALSICKASVFFGAQVLRGREARSDETGEQSSVSNERTAGERTSVFAERTALRGEMREPEASVVNHTALARGETPGASRTRERIRLS
jgi:hypothetical protein